MLSPEVVGERHYNIAREVRHTLATYEELKDIIAMLGLDELSQEDQRTVRRARQLERFFTQPFFVTEQFTGMEGRTVRLEDALEGCERILKGDFEGVSESAMYMIGGIGEVKQKQSKQEDGSEKDKQKASQESPPKEEPDSHEEQEDAGKAKQEEHEGSDEEAQEESEKTNTSSGETESSQKVNESDKEGAN
jgi:F-type H+-transporting ATPase subunit beta